MPSLWSFTVPGEEQDRREDKHWFERHAQTAAISICLALLFWGASTLVDIRDRISRFEERLVNLQAQVNQGVDDRFRGQDWRREKERLDERFATLLRRVDKLEENHAAASAHRNGK